MKFSEVLDNTPKTENKNFSSGVKRVRMSFALGSVPVEINTMPDKINFSENPKLSLFEHELENFSLLELIRISKLAPRVVIQRRVNEVLRLLNGMTPEKIKENRYTINNYLNQYITEVILRNMYNPSVSQINLVMLLGLQRWVSDLVPVRNLQRLLIRIKKAQKTTGFIPKMYQEKVKSLYNDVWHSFIKGIESKLPDSKRGILSGDDIKNTSGDEEKLAAFSSNITKSLEDKLSSIIEDGNSLDTIKSIKLTSDDKVKLSDDPVFGDKILTDAIIQLIESKLTEDKFQKYINDLMNNNSNMSVNFSHEPSTYITNLDWSPDHDEAYLVAPQYRSWFYFRFDETPNEFLLDVYKLPETIEYKFRSLNKEDILKDYKPYYTGSFKDEYEMIHKLNEIINDTDNNASKMNFSNDIKWSGTNKVKLGFDKLGNIYKKTKLSNGYKLEQFSRDMKLLSSKLIKE